MPSKRFHNLKPVKKRSFLKMAYNEFALHSFKDASITRLVGDLKMAKGSVYQYFDDKEDLYNYLVEHAETQLIELIEKTCLLPKSEEDFNRWLEKAILVQVKFLLAIPGYALLFSKHQSDWGGGKSLNFIKRKIVKASEVTGEQLSNERLYLMQNLPLLIFSFIIHSEKIKTDSIINSNSSIDIPTDKLLYLCEAFLRKS